MKIKKVVGRAGCQNEDYTDYMIHTECGHSFLAVRFGKAAMWKVVRVQLPTAEVKDLEWKNGTMKFNKSRVNMLTAEQLTEQLTAQNGTMKAKEIAEVAPEYDCVDANALLALCYSSLPKCDLKLLVFHALDSAGYLTDKGIVDVEMARREVRRFRAATTESF